MKSDLILIERNYQQKLTLADLVTTFDISKSKLIKLFNRYLQQTPIEYLNSFRIKQDCQQNGKWGLLYLFSKITICLIIVKTTHLLV
ncbi:AraC family transcriptional regulator [Limosilactobacillus pontis]|uniref:AraC family transcriptional regulator n=1 Tax=Limosilactobacillus pontis TaxID=35787 RepID=UPI0022465E59|nr:helix-turn-helix transcriptional regulator [Limosilactobacillus pontis]MCX2187364.1 AraC family transcriptional regulator [Limosilactobacillus pontis]MCX2188732.1 AraC family transcriptional regulator [Limosilactobacillus pontis]